MLGMCELYLVIAGSTNGKLAIVTQDDVASVIIVKAITEGPTKAAAQSRIDALHRFAQSQLR